jgi:hypothetical protein
MKSLLDLLPKGGNSLVDTLDNELKFFRRFLFLIQEAEEGIQHFLQGNLSHFDPHVGETACQIRAYYFALLWTEREQFLPNLERDLVQLKTYAERIFILINQGSLNGHRYLRPCSLSFFLEELGLDLKISETGWALIMSHILSKYRWVDAEAISQKMDEEKLSRGMSDTRRFSKELGRHLQKELSKVSTNFIFSLVNKLPQEKSGFVLSPELMGSLLIHDSFGREQLPCLIVFELIVRSLEVNPAIPVMLVMNFLHIPNQKFYFFFERDAHRQWILSNFEDCPADKSMFLLRGVSFCPEIVPSLIKKNFLEKMNEHGLSSLLRWFGAEHPQYSGSVPLINLPLFFRAFYEGCRQNALKSGVGLSQKNGFSLIFKHAISCRAGEFSKFFAKVPSMVPELTKVTS